MEQWIAFYNKQTGKELCAITVEGLFEGEITATKESLAYENGIGTSDIEVKIVTKVK